MRRDKSEYCGTKATFESDRRVELIYGRKQLSVINEFGFLAMEDSTSQIAVQTRRSTVNNKEVVAAKTLGSTAVHCGECPQNSNSLKVLVTAAVQCDFRDMEVQHTSEVHLEELPVHISENAEDIKNVEAQNFANLLYIGLFVAILLQISLGKLLEIVCPLRGGQTSDEFDGIYRFDGYSTTTPRTYWPVDLSATRSTQQNSKQLIIPMQKNYLSLEDTEHQLVLPGGLNCLALSGRPDFGFALVAAIGEDSTCIPESISLLEKIWESPNIISETVFLLFLATLVFLSLQLVLEEETPNHSNKPPNYIYYPSTKFQANKRMPIPSKSCVPEPYFPPPARSTTILVPTGLEMVDIFSTLDSPTQQVEACPWCTSNEDGQLIYKFGSSNQETDINPCCAGFESMLPCSQGDWSDDLDSSAMIHPKSALQPCLFGSPEKWNQSARNKILLQRKIVAQPNVVNYWAPKLRMQKGGDQTL